MDVVTQDEKFEIAQEIRIEKYFFARVKIQYLRIRFIIHNLFHVHNLKKKWFFSVYEIDFILV